METSADSWAFPVLFLEYVLMSFRAENVRLTEVVDTKMVTAKHANA